MLLLVPVLLLSFERADSKMLKVNSFRSFSLPLSLSVVVSLLVISNAAFIPTPSVHKLYKIHINTPSLVFEKSNSRLFYKAKNNEGENDDEQETETDKNSNLPSWYLPSNNKSESPERRERLVRVFEEMQRFTHDADELRNLRSDIASLKENLKWALATDDIQRAIDLTNAIENAQEKDPEIVYSNMLQKIENAQRMNVSKKYKLLPRYTEEAMVARKYIPRLNMDGLWLGK
jgi:hypothetical protein